MSASSRLAALAVLLVAAPVAALHAQQPVTSIRRFNGVNVRRAPMVAMRKRFEDAEDRRLSKGGSGGGIGTRPRGSVDPYAGLSDSQKARAMKVDAYLDNDLEAADPLIGKIIAGSMLFTLIGLLVAVFMYYGADGLAAATYNQRAIRGI